MHREKNTFCNKKVKVFSLDLLIASCDVSITCCTIEIKEAKTRSEIFYSPSNRRYSNRAVK